MKKAYEFFLTFHSTLVLIEKIFIVVMLTTIITLSFGQVLLRNLFSFGLVWIDQVTPVAVMWITFVGAALATEYLQHIKIDVLANLMSSELAKKRIDIIAQTFATVVAITLCYAAVDYIYMIMSDESCTVLEGIPDWNFKLVIPYCFFVMSYRCPIHILNIIQGKKVQGLEIGKSYEGQAA
jgi:TRAP-type C4-dicarboxylate transport system permease small subunit